MLAVPPSVRCAGNSKFPMTCPQPRPRQYHTAVTVAGQILVFGGLTNADSHLFTQDRAASTPAGAASSDAASDSAPVVTMDVHTCRQGHCKLMRPTLQHCQPAVASVAHARPGGMPPPPADPMPLTDPSRSGSFPAGSERARDSAEAAFRQGMRMSGSSKLQPVVPQSTTLSSVVQPSQLNLFDPSAIQG